MSTKSNASLSPTSPALSLDKWEHKLYSSYGYYLSQDKHPFCDTEFISSYFSKTNPNLGYQSFVEEMDIQDSSVHPLLIDIDQED